MHNSLSGSRKDIVVSGNLDFCLAGLLDLGNACSSLSYNGANAQMRCEHLERYRYCIVHLNGIVWYVCVVAVLHHYSERGRTKAATMNHRLIPRDYAYCMIHICARCSVCCAALQTTAQCGAGGSVLDHRVTSGTPPARQHPPQPRAQPRRAICGCLTAGCGRLLNCSGSTLHSHTQGQQKERPSHGRSWKQPRERPSRGTSPLFQGESAATIGVAQSRTPHHRPVPFDVALAAADSSEQRANIGQQHPSTGPAQPECVRTERGARWLCSAAARKHTHTRTAATPSCAPWARTHVL